MIHSCSYYCDRPECIKSQRDFLRGLVEQNAAPQDGGKVEPNDRATASQVSVPDTYPAVAAPTPRTDSEKSTHISFIRGWYGKECEWVRAEFARQLERELAAAVKRIADKHKTNLRWIERVDQAETALAEARAEIARLRNELNEAADSIESWGAYASDYFKDKHDLDADIKRFRDAVRGKP